MEDSLFFYNPWWTKGAVPRHMLKEFKRHAFYRLKNYMKLNRILVLKGPRRVGKTTILYQLIDDMLHENTKPENILYLSLDDPKLKIDFDRILDFYQTKILKNNLLDSGTVYVILDEVQFLENWQHYVKKYYDRNYPVKFMISGSSATLIRQGAESLMGRTVEETLLPFSFREFFEYHAKEKIETKRLGEIDLVHLKKYEAKAKIIFEKYMLKGGFPNIFEVEETEVWQKLVKDDIIDKAIYRDIVSSYDIKKPELLEKLVFYLADITGQILNVTNISGSIGLSREYANRYIHYLKSAYLVFTLKKYSKSVEKTVRSNEKVFIIDQGIANALLNKIKISDLFAGHLAETMVAKHLINHESYYWKNHYEIDFVVKARNTLIPIEVKYQAQINNSDLKGLGSFMEKFKIGRGIVVTKDLFDTKAIGNRELLFVPAWLFLLSEV